MILIGIGSNLSSPEHGGPRQVCAAALARLEGAGVRVAARSRWYESAPVPVSDQPWFVNAVAALETSLSPADLLAALHRVEASFGRVRRVVNEARVLDLDLLDHEGRVQAGPPVLPHPRLQQRAFVLLPLLDIAPGWRHPATGEALADLIAALPPDQGIRPAADQD
ncbi:2-amino-4-hydroxy-6-hydroxymethyldihydropteridine diphosphokinase [Aerophototrophica crusticola]|uniref:2-amino-4-hydroxy-6-hydroxymethyldihydropteridine pyrophosphokinase n=1 Tax=Aerophototrophica crusticola TaxID=1709002 RepID=A0A858R5D7_9PROT|nr:2-amino-4-hydroxy-6-hydroxymethyldihydropteridine diphosphokinase [Rhodospirillaceae bacterium B3]